MVYDIRTQENALKTLVEMTDIPVAEWNGSYKRDNLCQIDDFMATILERYNNPQNHMNYCDMSFIFSHITTSADGCSSIKKHGLVDLRKVYADENSELRKFLDNNEVYVNLDKRSLEYKGTEYDITYDKTVSAYCKPGNANASTIGYKFYHDFTACGFLSIDSNHAYGGNVHKRPEILRNIDNLLGTHLSEKWAYTHIPYEVIAEVSGDNVVYGGADTDYASEADKNLYYIERAYENAFEGRSSEVLLLLKDGVTIPKEDIKDIRRFLLYS